MSSGVPGVVMVSPGHVELTTVAEDHETLGEHEVLLATSYSLISPGTELAHYRGQAGRAFLSSPRSSYPFHPGYAAVGTVLDAGPASQFRAGQRVLAHTRHQSRVRVDVRRRLCLPIPDDVPDEIAPFCRLGQVGAVSLLQTHLADGDLVAVIGLGLVGNLAAQLARAAGFKALCLETLESRRDLARRCGLDWTVHPDQAEAALAGSAGAQLVLECSGRAAALLTATRVAGRRGQLATVGAPWERDTEIPASALVAKIFEKYLTLRSGWEWQVPLYGTGEELSIASCSRWVLACLGAGSVTVRPLITDIVDPGRVSEAYRHLDEDPERHVGILINWRS